MDRDLLSYRAHADHPIAAPLSDDSVRRLIDRTVHRADARVLDLGCGSGAWLLRTLSGRPGVRAEGVDLSATALRAADERATAAGVRDRLDLHRRDATDFPAAHAFDAVLSVGATHAFGGLLPTLAAAREHLAPGGRVLIGDGLWERGPSPEAVALLGDFTDLATTVDRVVAEGWTPVYGHVSTREELDAYEWCWTGSLASWALDHPDDPDAAEALARSAVHRGQWLRVYRDSFGFLSLVLRRTDG
ncbi:SAM-dependent methyltransferase [Streptomyces clavuligerus]|uniref:Putative SAM-dependent methyltransferase n=1 Tax=Streptomyces clavuligerus TaxID=1901 RepID=E2Q5U5_STRCL|nr:class I SAM-dependent methyltransferase [Streptomyces clavuligerus]ANW21707.1 SAM-dependent methyltransferase [Streptomyces clavuligerus]AXU16336.1 class I SAM-dependent methyltransferase [Streptomyces clavuligerus]EFG05105.1 Putative SAM-dependent methyltransferase [Streptomyces clavuligerus]MBY6306497.1 class I SAM-dependent methyltransferase [Streptomyces clavuligerus]QCS09116.1 class I SAM-dependent methyltransferase [Streptomyces clavuligerus]